MKVIFTLCLSIVSFCLFCQQTETSRNFHFGLGLSESLSTIDGVTLNPGLELNYKLHNLTISWKIYQGEDSYYIENDCWNNNVLGNKFGLNSVYRYSPYKLTDNLRFSFLSYLSYSKFKHCHTTTYQHGSDRANAMFYSIKDYIAVMFGYGLDYKIVRGLYIRQSFAFGLDVYKENQIMEISDFDHTVFDTTSKYRENIELSFIVKEIGLDFLDGLISKPMKPNTS